MSHNCFDTVTDARRLYSSNLSVYRTTIALGRSIGTACRRYSSRIDDGTTIGTFLAVTHNLVVGTYALEQQVSLGPVAGDTLLGHDKSEARRATGDGYKRSI